MKKAKFKQLAQQLGYSCKYSGNTRTFYLSRGRGLGGIDKESLGGFNVVYQ